MASLGAGQQKLKGLRKSKLAMPKVDVSTDNTLTDALKALGVEKAFGSEADFSGISEDVPLVIDSIIQKTRLIMDEEGTKAAAATGIPMAAMAAPIPEKIEEFNMDRPFVIVIADEVTGAACFAGVVANPAGN